MHEAGCPAILSPDRFRVHHQLLQQSHDNACLTFCRLSVPILSAKLAGVLRVRIEAMQRQREGTLQQLVDRVEA